MNVQILLDDIFNYSNNNKLENFTPLILLEYIRFNIIERLRSENNSKVLQLVNMIKTHRSIAKDLKARDLKLKVLFNYYDKKSTIEKAKSTYSVLEIALSGKKSFQIFDKLNKNKYIFYKIVPFYGVVYSTETVVSSRVVENTAILNINIEDKLKKE